MTDPMTLYEDFAREANANNFTVLLAVNRFHPSHAAEYARCVSQVELTLAPMPAGSGYRTFIGATVEAVVAQARGALEPSAPVIPVPTPPRQHDGWTEVARRAQSERMKQRWAEGKMGRRGEKDSAGSVTAEETGS